MAIKTFYRVIEYRGPEDHVSRTLNKSLADGVNRQGDMTLTVTTVDENIHRELHAACVRISAEKRRLQPVWQPL